MPTIVVSCLAAGARVGLPAEGLVTAFVLDTSGSVGKAGLGKTRELALKTLAALPPGSEIAIYTFDDQSRLLLPRTREASAVTKALSAVSMAGKQTALHDALYDASRYLRDAQGRSAIVLITDGKDEGSALNLDDGLRLAQEARIPIFCVGVGVPQERILRRIAKLTGGEYMGIQGAKGAGIAAGISAATARMAYSAASGAGPAPGPPAAPAAAASASPKAVEPAPAATRSPSSKAPPPKPFQEGASSGRGSSFWIGLGLILAAGAAAVLFVIVRRRGTHRCPSCGRPLPSALSSCAFCADTQVPVGDRTLKADLSPTVLARLNDTAEYLEKTVTLREKPVLSVTRGPGTGQLYELNEGLATSIGRAKANDIVLQDISVSSQHCRIWPENGSFVLQDLHSTNGTFVNERRVTHHTLTDGDTLQIGETFMEFHKEHRRV